MERRENDQLRGSRMALSAAERKRRHRERVKLRLAAPGLSARAADPAIPDEQLTPLERAVRSFRVRVLDDLGGADGLPLTRLLQVEALSERWLVKGMLTTEILDLGEAGRLVDRRAIRARALLGDWLKTLDGYERALRDVGLDHIEQTDPADTLEGIVAGIVASRPPVAAKNGSGGAQADPRPADPGIGAQVSTVAERGPDARVISGHRQAPEPVEVRPVSLTPEPAAPAIEF